MQEMYNQVNELLKAKFPTQEERDVVIADIGELIVSETYVELLESVQDEEVRKRLVEALNNGSQEEVVSITESLGLDLYKMLEDKSKQIMDEATN